MQKIKDRLFYAGLDKASYKDLKNELRADNNRVLRYYAFFSVLIMLALLVVSLFVPSLVKNRALYTGCGIFCIVLLLVDILTKKLLTRPLMYLYICMVLFFGIALGTLVDPGNLAIMYSVILFAVSLVFTTSPFAMILLDVGSMAVFFVLAAVTQTPEMIEYNATNIIPIGLLSIASAIYLMKVKVERLSLKKEKISRVEMENTDVGKKQSSRLEALANFIQAIMVFNTDESDGHCKRVRRCARLLAERYQAMYGTAFSDSDLELVEVGAQLHDIGKIYIPQYIFSKKEALTEEEKKIIKNHTVVGADLADSALKVTGIESSIIHNIVLYHHERWDGQGYPKGLMGTDIPLEAQITGVAEVYDVLRSKGNSHEHVLQMIMDGVCGSFSENMLLCLDKCKEDLHMFYDNTETERWDLLSEAYKTHSTAYWKLKRIFDVVLSAGALVCLSPLFLGVMAWIKIDDPKSPVFFKQVRVGRHKKEFEMYKFRTMVPNAEALLEKLQAENEKDGPVFKIKDDPRITAPGHFLRKTSIDELPQLINIIKGDMTIVGPRPPLPSEVEKYSEYHEMRLRVTPGLTCLWQASDSRDDIPFEEWMDLDVAYIGTRSLATDFKIILKTANAVLKGTGH